MKFPGLVVSAWALFAAAESHAVTLFNITDNHGSGLPNENVADGATYSTALGLGSSVSINVNAQTSSTGGSLFFDVLSSPFNAILDIVVNSNDFTAFGPITVTLSDGATVSDIVTAANTEVILTGLKYNSPLEVSFSWTKAATGSFNADLEISPIPLPAAGWLLLSGLGGMAALRRFGRA
jgi:hypothetical protein